MGLTHHCVGIFKSMYLYILENPTRVLTQLLYGTLKKKNNNNKTFLIVTHIAMRHYMF